MLTLTLGKNASALNVADINTSTSAAHDRQGEEMMELEGVEEGSAEGTYLAYPIPPSLSSVPPSPSTSTDGEYSVDNSDAADIDADASDGAFFADIAAEMGTTDTAPFFAALGLSTAITGFSSSGDLVLCLDYPALPPCLSPKRSP